ncbi:ATP-binding protein [Georgenia yuyongxinii]|uniref:ATP-binding protein n=1 Tax=Georgenia yuyongxinii TaxID=2589797 RepID=A0A552WXM6_9MICO|nr:ATP-binding protein [Georgenia yuyongxinii]TRW47426.1 ATP-binding protein [Georgenia yuyongxinii]
MSLDGAGGDGGVECYWTLPDDTEHGHQAKYWTNHSDVDKTQLDNSVKAALKQHPKLTKYTVAIPADPTGRTGGRGKSLLEKINDPGGWLEGWNDMAAARLMAVEFEIEWATNIVTRLERLDATGIQRRYWFDADVLDAKWWNDRLEDAVNAARPRYMPELNVEVPAARCIAALCSDDDWWTGVAEQIDEVEKSARRVRRAKGDELAAGMDVVLEAAAKVTDALTAWHRTRTTSGFDDLAHALNDASNIVDTQETAETTAMDSQYSGENWDTASWRQWRAEYMVSFPTEGVDSLRELQEKLAETTDLLISTIGRLAGSQVALMTGAAGVGKTYLAIDAVAQRLAKGRPSVMMHGRWFTNTDPLMYLRDVLKMPSDLTGEDTIALLDESGRAAGVPTLLVIDALNDTRPRSLWRDNLDRLITTVERHPNVRLLLTARIHYVRQVIPSSVTMPKFEHTGFEGVEFEALGEYAAFYGLEPPTSPPIHGEFDNPLYLRLVCEALKSNARLSLDQAVMGLDELTTMVLHNANTIISDRIDASPSDRVVHQAMHALASAIADAGSDPWLTRARAQAQLAPIWSERSAEKSLLDALISQGLVEEDVVPDGSAHGADIIAITFERIGHHLIVSDALSGVTHKAGIAAELDGRLGRVIGLGGTIDPGILEATSVVVAERYGLELAEFATEIRDDDAVAAAVVAGTAWRNDTSITSDTRAIVIDALHREDVCAATLTMLFRLAARPHHPLNADYLHEFLTSVNMGARDSFIPGWFHDSYGTSGAVDRLIRWAREKPLDQVGEETTRLWVTALLWTTSATDRRVREPATIAAARLLTRHPGLAAGLLERFTDVDDEWVVERACAVAYAALLGNGSADDWTTAAEIVWRKVFSVSSAVTPNGAVRDAARSILEAAADRDALPAGLTAAQFRPPYTSDWPIPWPTKGDIGKYDTNDYPKLVFSTSHDDFFTYQLSPELRDRPGIDLDAAARWVVEEVIRLGYRPEWHAWFDRYVLGKYGMGRSKPAWIERIGKKYQWIALNRLLGIVSDHVPKSPSSWDPPTPLVPGPQSDISRQVDPTVVEFPPVDPTPRAWVGEYDWTPTVGMTDAEWIADDTDLPTVAVNEATFDGRPFVVLSGTYGWSNATDTTERTRGMWTHVYPHLVATADLPVAITELENRDLTGSDLARPPQVDDGYVGEYPYGHHHGKTLHVIDHEWRESLSVPTLPAAWHISSEYGYAPDELHTISLDVPAPDIFGPVPGDLHWNGRNGWADNDGQLVAVVRHTANAGRNELLVAADWIEQWLTVEMKSLIWVQNTGKEVYRGFGASRTSPGALSRSLVQSWTPGSDVQPATPGWYRLPANGE